MLALASWVENNLFFPTILKQVGRKAWKKERVHLDVAAHIIAMGDDYFCCKYLMRKKAFFHLFDVLDPFLPNMGEVQCLDKFPNGPITKMSQFCMALYFAGGDPLDIDNHHRVCKGQTLISVWQVVDFFPIYSCGTNHCCPSGHIKHRVKLSISELSHN